MPRLITAEAHIRRQLPNIISTVKGETPFIERLSLPLDFAEEWVRSTFTGAALFEEICAMEDGHPLREAVCALAVADAMRRAIPTLDVVLTPNGFGVVSTQNLAPASSGRVEALKSAMLRRRDECIATLLRQLRGVGEWHSTPQAAFFGATLFPDLGIVDALGGDCPNKWDKYNELHPQLIDLEGQLAGEWLSHELLEQLRVKNMKGTLTQRERFVTAAVQTQLTLHLRTGSFNRRRLEDTVTFIREHRSDFTAWHTSATAQLFAPPTFNNVKSASGYFF